MAHTSTLKDLYSSSSWKILFLYLLEFRRLIIFLSVLGVASAIANAFVPLLVGHFFDALLAPKTMYALWVFQLPLWAWFLSAFVGASLVANGVDWVIDRKSRRIGTNLAASYPSRVFSHLLKLPLSFHAEHKTGELSDQVQRARNGISTIIENVIINLAPQFLSIFVGFIIAYFIHPLFALLLASGVALYILTLFYIVPPLITLQWEGHRAWGRAWGVTMDAVYNIQAVKHATAEDYEKKKIHRSFVGHAFPAWYKIEKIWSDINFYQRVVVVLTQVAIFITAVFLIQDGSITIGGLIAANGYAAMVFGPFVILGHNWQVIQNGLIAVEQTQKLIELPEESYAGKNKKTLGRIRGDIEFRNISFAYEKNEQVLHNLTFSANAGERVAFVGESGVGKSTAIDLISGYYFPTEGSVKIDGHDIRDVGLRSLRKQIAIVPQEVVLLNDTVRENIKFGTTSVSLKQIEEAAKQAHAHEFITRFSKGYQQLVGERGIKLSVGQKQRIAIARAVLRNPRILILDEPTSALDARTEQLLSESFERLMEGRTTFIIAHRLSTVRSADKILVFEKGRIVEEGAHEELIKKPGGVYRRLYEYQIGLHA